VSQDPYAGIAASYDLFEGPFVEHGPDVTAFFRGLFADHVVRRVLDCACGTGRHLHLFSTLGCDVVGSDLSEAMLARARENLSGCGLSVPLHRVDYRELPARFARVPRFDAVTCLSSSILHMPTEDEVRRAFRSMHGVLRTGGLLVLTQGTSDRQWREKPRFLLAVDEPEVTRLFVIDYLGTGARYNVVDIYHTGEEQGLRVWSIEYPRMYLAEDQVRLLREAGFVRVAVYGTYGRVPYDVETSRRLIVVARR
jgi:SAM-dependent methyltransferase